MARPLPPWLRVLPGGARAEHPGLDALVQEARAYNPARAKVLSARDLTPAQLADHDANALFWLAEAERGPLRDVLLRSMERADREAASLAEQTPTRPERRTTDAPGFSLDH